VTELSSDLAVNVLLAVATIGMVMVLSRHRLVTTNWRDGLPLGLFLGAMGSIAMLWWQVSHTDVPADFRPGYLALAFFLLDWRIGVLATGVPLAADLLLIPAHWPEHVLLLLVGAAWSAICGAIKTLRPDRRLLWPTAVVMSLGLQVIATLASNWGWVRDHDQELSVRLALSTLVLCYCVELILIRLRDEHVLVDRETEMLQVLNAAGGGRWERDLRSDQTQFKGSFYDQFDLSTHGGEDFLTAWRRLWHQDDMSRLEQVLQDMQLSHQDDFDTEYRVKDRQGRWRWVMSRGRVVERDAQGASLRLVGLHLDVTRQREMDEALRLSQAKFQTIYEALPDAAGISRISDGRYLEVNPAFCTLLGRPRHEVLGRTSIEVGVWASETQRLRLLAEFRDKGEVNNLPLDARTRDGTVVPGRMSARHIDMLGEPCFIFLFHDIREQIKMEQHLRTVNALLQQAGRLAKLGVWEDTGDPATRYWSDTCFEIHGLPVSEHAPENYIERFITPQHRAHFIQALRRCVKEQIPFDQEIQIVRSDGALRWMHTLGEPVIEGGKVKSVRGVVRDIDDSRRNQDRLRESEERFTRIFRTIPDPMGICLKGNGHYLEVNTAWESAMGITRAEALSGKSVVDIGVYTQEAREKLIETAYAAGSLNAYEIDFTPRSGELRTALQSMQSIEIDGEPCWLFSIKDITERKRAEKQVQEREALLSLTIEAASVALWDFNLQTGLVTGDANWRRYRGLPDTQGWQEPEVWTKIVFEPDIKVAKNALTQHLANPGVPFDATLRVHHRDGTMVWIQNLGRVIRTDAKGRPERMVGVALDVTRQRLQEEQLQRLAHYDALTGLPNRVLLADRLSATMELIREQGGLLGVAYLDLDGFKPVNDTLGHGVGDQLLMTVAQRLQSALRPQDLVARLGGDEFVILLNNPGQARDCEALLRRLMAGLAEAVVLEGEALMVTASIGLTIFPHDDSDADTLLRHADQAMYQAKQLGRNRIQLFDAESARASREQLNRLARLQQALIDQEFVLHVQPKVDMLSGRVIGSEALARWQHPKQGLLPPGEFLAQIEGSNLEIPFGEWVIQASLALLQAWMDDGLTLPLSLNISARHLQSANFADRVRQLLGQQQNVPAYLIELEITESAALTDIHAVSHTLNLLRAMGLKIAIDDFGTGYSSLTYLRMLPVDTLKIDRSFVCGMMTDPGDMAIVNGVIGLSRSFGLSLIAEGVETAAQGRRLLDIGCRLAQGYGVAKPMPAADFARWVKHWKAPSEWLAGSDDASA
jgi:diguanylate cyclase (GGDEF)-like protein/PAS domain S-box-containing protein